MKKIIASAGLLALGATGVHAAIDPAFDSNDNTKIWNVAATLRGFYDDNYDTQPSNARDFQGNHLKRDSFGFEISPKALIHYSNEQTDVGAQYVYSYRWYEDRDRTVPVLDKFGIPKTDGSGNIIEKDQSPADQAHFADAWLKHRFNERYSMLVADSFVIAQEPSVVDPNLGTPTRSNGNNLRNYGSIFLNADLTECFGLGFGYQNTYYDYKNEDGTSANPSRSALLDRIEHLANIDFRWRIQPTTTAFLGYQFGLVDYIGDEPVGLDIDGNDLPSEVRNSRSHYVYVGVEHQFNEYWNGMVRVGGRYNDYYNTPNEETDFSPYAKLMTRYTYLPGSYVELGFQHDRNATDVVASDSKGHVTTDQESSTLYGTVNHRITPKLTGSVLGQIQHSTFNNGDADNDSDNFYIAGVNLTYRFNHYLSTEVGYNYDRLDSDGKNRSYTRNRVYIGVTGNY